MRRGLEGEVGPDGRYLPRNGQSRLAEKMCRRWPGLSVRRGVQLREVVKAMSWMKRGGALLALGLAVSLAGGAWQGVPTEHLFVLVQEGIPDPAGVAALAEGVLQEVWALWLPQGLATQLPRPFQQVVSPEVIARAREAAGLPPPSDIPCYGVVLYSDPEALWRDVDWYGIGGTYYSGRYGWDLGERLQARAREAGAPPDWAPWGYLLGYCPEGDCPAVIAHELTHALQDYAGFQIPTDGCPVELDREPRLIVEGMARWTEFALGYSGDPDLRVRGPVAIWLELGGTLEEVPEFFLYEVGASLFEYLSFNLSPLEILALFSRPQRELLGLPESNFPDLFRLLYGAGWEEFLAGWQGWVEAVPPPPGAELVYEERRLGIGLRTALLWPLLSQGEREEIASIRRAIWEGRAGWEDLVRADAILKGAWAEPTEELISALERRSTSLRDWARVISGPEASARVSALWLIRNAEPDAPERYLRAFVEAVNEYLVSPAPSPLGSPVP